MKSHTAFLRLILTRWEWAVTQVKIHKLGLMKPHRAFADQLAAEIIQTIFQWEGDWRAAVAQLERDLPPYPDAENRIKEFKRWAKKITSPARRGLLLEWKGGAK